MSLALASYAQAFATAPEYLVRQCDVGQFGGRLVVTQRAEPKTLNPVTAMDGPSREIVRRMMADLVTINRLTQLTEPSLAQSWTASKDGRHFTIRLRQGIRFSDGHPFDADDVIFSFQVYLDEKVHASQRDLLIVGDQPIAVRKQGPFTVSFDLAKPYSTAERIFDSIAILPRHLLQETYEKGELAQAWGLTVDPTKIAGLGPFRLKEYRPGERLILERNPFFWQTDPKGNRLPYLNEIEFLFVGSEDSQVARYLGGEVSVLNRIGAKNFALLADEQKRRDDRLLDLGPGLEYNFLFFNLNPGVDGKSPEISAKQRWFDQIPFRQSISLAIDREAIVRLAFSGHAAPLWSHVSPGNKLWFDPTLPKPSRSIARAKDLLKNAGFSWNSAGNLQDHDGKPVEFSLLTSASNTERVQAATIIQDDLKQLGIRVTVVPLEFRSFVDRVLNTHNFEAAVMGLGGGDGDPNSELNVWLSSGGTHVWNPGQKAPATSWEAEIDRLMERQLETLNYKSRKQLYDQVQRLVATDLPVICFASPNTLVAARGYLGNFRPAILDHYTLWNAAELYIRRQPNSGR